MQLKIKKLVEKLQNLKHPLLNLDPKQTPVFTICLGVTWDTHYNVNRPVSVMIRYIFSRCFSFDSMRVNVKSSQYNINWIPRLDQYKAFEG